jgi:ribosome-associated toxin RatA of RatAB toxin-antitoxin module
MNAIAKEPFARRAALMNMEMHVVRFAARALLAALVCAGAAASPAAFELTSADAARIQRGDTVIHASLDARQRGTVHAALIIDAPPAVVFQAMTRCDEALAFVPHLRSCRVQSTSADSGVQIVEHEIDLGWHTPRMRYAFRAELVADRRIAFQQVAGDFKVNQGVWDFEPDATGERTLVRYRVRIDPPGYVPGWLARATFRRELPQLLENLRRHCEDGDPRRQIPGAWANIFPEPLPR